MSFANIQIMKDTLTGSPGQDVECGFEVLNTTEQNIRIGVEAIVLRNGEAIDEDATRNIARIKGDNEIKLEGSGQDKVVVNITLPEATQDDDYTLELRVYDVRDTEKTVTSPAVAITPEQSGEVVVEKDDKKTNWGLIIGGIVGGLVLLIGGGIGIYFAIDSGGDEVPNVVNMTSEEASDALAEVELTALITEEVTGNAEPGVILSQSPEPGADIPEDGAVSLVMEASSAALPSLIGLTAPAAEAKLVEAGFQLGEKTYERGGNHPGGAVIAQNPAAGERLLPGQPVDLTIEKEMVRVPKLAGMDLTTAKSVLQSAGLSAKTKTGKGAGTPGTVIAQSPKQDVDVDRGSSVLVTIKEKTVKMPNLRGKTVDAATVALTRLGLQVSAVKTKRSNKTSELDKVVSQVPAAGKEVYSGGDATLVVARRFSRPGNLTQFVVTPNIGTIALAANSATCKNALNGKIAWDYKNSKSWNAANVARLCKGAETSTAPAQCFNKVMHGNVSWGGGTRWQWGNAINLCAGATNANNRVSCFTRQVQSGKTWQKAISACNSKLYAPRATFSDNSANGH